MPSPPEVYQKQLDENTEESIERFSIFDRKREWVEETEEHNGES